MQHLLDDHTGVEKWQVHRLHDHLCFGSSEKLTITPSVCVFCFDLISMTWLAT
jgi:hypothetical protein